MSSKDKKSTPSAAGERRALTGLLPQYGTAASLILAALRRRELEFVEIAHDANGAVDDIVIGTANRVDAFQVKWGQHPEAFTFRSLVSADNNGRTLIRDLLEGWKRLSSRYPTKRVVVSLYTCDYPSTNDNCQPKGQPPLAFAQFIDQVWMPAQGGDLTGVRAQSSAWKELVDASRAEESAFLLFVKDCRLMFGMKPPGDPSDNSRDGICERDQVRELSQLLKELAINPQNVHHFDRRDLLTRLDWARFFELRNRHEFSVTPAYEEIEAPAKRLNVALDTLRGGYLFVGGSPGSGKSSLLTRTFEQRAAKERWVRYYAFVPGSPEPGNVRGESENFLHDLTTALEDAGVISGKSRSDFDRQQLITRLDAQLQALGKDYHDRGMRTVLLIDGLDHVPREQRPQTSMLKDLPLPERVPEGVFVLLGSQTDLLDDIPAAVRTAIAARDRRILMEPLSPPAVLTVVDRSGLPISLNDDQRQAVVRLSQGHPLALGLLMNHLRTATDEAAIAEILESTEPYAGDIDTIYQSYWDEIAPNHELVYLLALLGRLRRHIDVGWLHSFNGHAVMSQLKTRLGHLFLREAESRWFFFHNSFRLFVRRKTSTLVAGSEMANDEVLHRELAKQCAIAPAVSPWSWERLFHLVEAGEHEAALDLATPQFFREQLLSLRPIEAIADDIRHAMNSAKATNNPLALVRLVLAAAEFAQRANGISDADVTEVLLRLGNVDIAMEHLFDGRELRVSNDQALASSRRLARIERYSEGRRLFELAQPLTAQVKTEGIRGQSAQESLTAWVKAAVHFRPLNSILTFIDSLQVEAGEFNNVSTEVATRHLRADLSYHLVLALRQLGREDDAASVERRLDTDDLRRGWWFWLQVERWREALSKGDKVEAAKVVRATVARLPLDSLGNDQRIFVVEALYQAEGVTDEVKEQLSLLRQPEPFKDHLSAGDVLPAFHERFRLNRLLRALGRDGDPLILVPESSDFEGQGAVYFERAIVRIALIWGDAWRARFYSAADIRQQAGDLLRLYSRDRRERLRWRSWHSFSAASKDLYSLLIDAVRQHGPEALRILAGMFDEEWRHERRKRNWSTVTRRSVILDLYSAGIDRQWAADQLCLIEPTMLKGEDISGRIQECREQAEAWARLQQPDDGLVWLKEMLDTSFGVGYRKDYQLENWMEWLPAINDADPAGAPGRFAWFAVASQVVDESTEGRSARTATEKLVALAGAWSPRRAVSLLNWFEDHGPVWYGSCTAGLVEVLLEKQGLSTPLAKAAIEFLLWFSKESRSSLTEKYIRLGWKRGAAGAVDGAFSLYRTISTLPLPTSRHGWVSGLRTALIAVGVDPPPEMPVPIARESGAGNSGPERSVTLDDGTVLTGQDFEQRASTLDGLLYLVTHVEDGYFKWSDYFDHVASSASVADLRRLASAAAGMRDESLTLSKVSFRQTAAGDRSSAWTTAWKALEASREYGWTRWGDGGTRVEALSALIAADPTRGRANAFDAFASDMLRRRSYPSEVVNNLREIVSLLFDQVPIRQVWKEIQSYLMALCPKIEARAQPDLAAAPPLDTADRAVVDLLARHLAGPINLLAYGAQHGLGELLLRKDAEAIAVVREMLASDDDGKVMAAMGVVEAVAEHGIEYTAPFRGELISVIDHRCFPVWCSARDLLFGLGEQQIAERPQRPLPAVYLLEIPEDEAVRHPLRPEPIPGEPLPDPLHWLEALTPFHEDLSWVANVLRRPAVNLLYRARQIMDELYDEEEWCAKAETRLRARLDDAGLKFTFQRPRAQVARQAMYYALSELFDARKMRPDEARFLYESLRPYDPVLLLMRASPRPAEIVAIEGLGSYGHATTDWVAALRSAPPRFTANIGDRIVVGEMTKLRRLSWELPTVHVHAAVTTRELGPSENLWLGYRLTNVKEYPSLREREKTLEYMIVMKEYDGRDSDCAQWIALNPEIPRQLGWTLDRNGLFRWVDSEGGLMAETIWWKDGSLDHQPPEHDDEVGEGWLVVMSERGVRQMIARFGPILRTVEDRRMLTTEDSQHNESRRVSSEVVVS